MSWTDATRARLRLLFARRAAESRMEDEFRFHMQMETEQNIRAGMTPDEARRRARMTFGGIEEHKEAMRDDRGLAWLGGSSLDLKLGLRMLAKYPGLAVVGGLGMAVATAIGVGAHAFFNSYMSPDLPLHEGERVVAIVNLDVHTRDSDKRVLHDLDVWRRELRSVVDLGAFRTMQRNLITTSGRGEPVVLAEMSASGFRVARVPPLLGRTLLDADERPGAPHVVVIGHDVWQSRFQGDSGVVGRRIRLGNVVHTVVGVMPPSFAFPVSHSWWVALRLDPQGYAPGNGPGVDVFGRLVPGGTMEGAQAELTVVGRRIAAASPQTHARLVSRVIGFTDIFTEGDGDRWEFRLLQVMISMVLVLVCMNVAVLVYARTVSRTAEIAMRTALGATRKRIVAQLFAEAFVLSVLSTLVGLAIVVVGLRYFDRLIALISETGRAPFWIDPGLSVGTVLYALALAVLGAGIVGVLPALRATGTQLQSAIGVLGGGVKAQLGRTWTSLIVVQVAITVAVLPPALQKGAQLLDQATQKPGFPAEAFLAVSYLIEREDETLSDAGPSSPELAAYARATQTELTSRLASEPGVVGVTFADGIPGGESDDRIEIDDDGTTAPVRIARVDASFFDVFDVKLVAGRTFDLADGMRETARPVVVNRSFAAEVFGGADVVGRRVRAKRGAGSVEPWQTIVGVVEDFPVGIRDPDQTYYARVYRLAAAGELPRGRLFVRVRGTTPAAFALRLREVATGVDRTLQLRRVRPLDVVYAERGRVMLMLALALALGVGSVVLLSAAGIYSLMSFTVNQRRREIGVRAALGADARRILTGVLSRATGQLAVGAAVGLAFSVVIDRLTGGDLMGGKALIVVPGIAAFMVVVGLLAAAGPAIRGLRVQPTEALRAEV